MRHGYSRLELQAEESFRPQPIVGQISTAITGGAIVSTGVVSRARAYIGHTASQVGVRSTLWCSAFVRKMTGARGVDDRALSWLAKRRVGKSVGAVAVMYRKGRGNGHVGIVSGFDARGNPIIISGNSRGRRVAEHVVPAGRVAAYVSPE